VLEHVKDIPGDAISSLLQMDDATCLHTLTMSKNSVARDLAGSLYRRRLYKRALYAGSDQVNTTIFHAGVSIEKCREYATEIAHRAGVLPQEVLVDIPSLPREISLGVRVQNQHAVVSLEEISPRARTLNETRREQWRLGVYTLPEYREKVAEAGIEVLHLKKPTRQDTLF
jgi:uncharacterized protein